MSRRKKIRIGAYGGILLVTLGLNVLAWNSRSFCDAYIAHVFPIWVSTYGRLTGCAPFSVGEWMIVAGLLLVAVAVLLGAVLLVRGIWCLVGRLRWKVGSGRQERKLEQPKVPEQGQKTGRWLMRCAGRYYTFFAWVLLFVAVIMTLNCFILYHASTFSQRYFGEETGEYELEELIQVYNHVVTEVNRLSALVERDGDGRILYPGSLNQYGELVDLEDKAIETMQQLGQTYAQLDGYYPRPKALMSSDFICQQYMQGYYFPFSMEANYNDVMYIMNKPATMCHELAHLRGYIYEDEANFISFLACVQSDDLYFQYSGYLSVLNYLGNDLYDSSRHAPERYAEAIAKVEPVAVLAQVRKDDIFVLEEEWERIEANAWWDTETVDNAADVFIDTTLKVNGVADGKVSYSRVVRLLLQYYEAYEIE